VLSPRPPVDRAPTIRHRRSVHHRRRETLNGLIKAGKTAAAQAQHPRAGMGECYAPCITWSTSRRVKRTFAAMCIDSPAGCKTSPEQAHLDNESALREILLDALALGCGGILSIGGPSVSSIEHRSSTTTTWATRHRHPTVNARAAATA